MSSSQARETTLRAPAKINLTLEVVEKLPSGFHNLRSVIVKLDRLADVIDIRIGAGTGSIVVTCDSQDVPEGDGNICYSAAHDYLAAIGERAGVDIHIQKNIPIAAGLGGGSSDAATVLLALNRHFRSRLSAPDLAAIGSNLGKDIPFFLGRSKTGIVSDTGVRVSALPALPRAYFLIVNPRVFISTKNAYQALAEHVWFMSHGGRSNISAAMVKAIERKDIARVAMTLYNDFEVLVERNHPVIKEIKQSLVAFGADGALMSGSGSTVFGLFKSRKALQRAEDALRAHYPDFIISGA